MSNTLIGKVEPRWLISQVLLAGLGILLSSCEAYRSLRYGILPRQRSYHHFQQRKIAPSLTPFRFERALKPYMLGHTIGLTTTDLNSTNVTLDSFVTLHKTIAFLIIRHDTLVYEYYRPPCSDTSLVSSFSLAKPIVSTLVGMAIDEGKINSIQDRLVDYLPEFKAKPGWANITLKHLLHHTSGIKFTDNPLNPFSDNAEFYWGTNLRQKIGRLTLEGPPDSRFHYSSANTLLLSYVLEKVTGNTLSTYLQEKLWKPLAMEAPAYWSVDRPDQFGTEKAFCCLQARALDFAKFGRLYLRQGDWNGQQLISKQWVAYSTHPDPSGNNKHFYNNNWGIGPLKYGSYYAVGLYGQFLYMYPEKDLLIVRFGETDLAYSPSYWSAIFLQLVDQL